jgi:tripartite ATP-independent transporter DctM subunit
LLIAGILPGLLTGAIYEIMIVVRCWLNPALAPRTVIAATSREKIDALLAIWPILVLVLGIIGGLLSGLVTPTEAGAFGASLAFVIAYFQRQLNWQVIKGAALEAVAGTSQILFVAVGAVLLTKYMALTGVPTYLGNLIGEWALDQTVLIIGLSLVYLLLGMFLDPIGIMLLTLPIFLPMFEALKFDLVWLGVIVVKYLEIGMLTPPVGFNVYVVKSVVGNAVSLETIFRGVGWFLVCEIFIMALIIGFPQISLYLPSLLN